MKPKSKEKELTPSIKRNRARKVTEKLLAGLPATFTDRPLNMNLEKFRKLEPREPFHRTHRKRVSRSQNNRAFRKSGFVYNGACPAGYAVAP